MNWIIVSLLSAFSFAVVSVLDKVILVRYITNARAFIVMVGMIQIPMGLLVLPFVPLDTSSFQGSFIGYISGFIWGVSLIAMFWAMSKDDVSKVIPVMSISPVFVAILAVVFLSESLSAWHWVAIVVTVAGAALISVRLTGRAFGITLGPTFLLLLFGSVALAGGQFLSKVALEDISLWNLYTLRSLGLGSACILLVFRPEVVSPIRRALFNLESFTVFFVTEGLLVFVALVLSLWAIDLGPVSLVATVFSTRPLFVFAMSLLLSTPLLWRILDEPMDRKTLTNKVVSTTMIVGGISALSLL